jgi:hypothetical protein
MLVLGTNRALWEFLLKEERHPKIRPPRTHIMQTVVVARKQMTIARDLARRYRRHFGFVGIILTSADWEAATIPEIKCDVN